MGIKDILNKVTEHVKAAAGEESVDKTFHNEQQYPDAATARQEFERAKQKLFQVDRWSDLSGINSTFALYDAQGAKKNTPEPAVGDYVQIILPASTIENWVMITDLKQEENRAEFTVHPSENPQKHTKSAAETQHFFGSEASSTFRVELKGLTLRAYEIGQNERANNQGAESGDREVLNTMISAGGWAAFQALQWNKLTAYLVHLEEAKEA